MRYLLDVNVLVALIDPDHVHSDFAHGWWVTADHQFATCPLTENGAIRILSNPNYSSTVKFTTKQVIERLSEFAELYDHEFWPDDISLRDSKLLVTDRIFGARQITDIYLLALAIKNGGCLITFDTGIPTSALANMKATSLVVLET
ncbi:MAG TPA: PIN domain-containing protein [Pyrinomonadaceae bacterium]|nr:PIN domain-containing protein [Acidobacteriota bacterium]HQZ95725.1 PIN domain-containing protein [Pyrinomonadaceae bacterium]